MTWMTLDPDDVVTLAEVVGVDPYGKSARRLRAEIVAGFERAFSEHRQRSRGRPGVGSGERHSGTGAAGRPQCPGARRGGGGAGRRLARPPRPGAAPRG